VGTRHNVGFHVLQALADKQQWRFVRSKGLQGSIARGVLGEKKVILLMPETYMNSSGESVRAALAEYELPRSQVCVVCDDIYLPLGALRMRAFGGSGGHNGLKSIDAHLGTNEYPRLRIGVGDRVDGDLSDHVLSRFLPDELEKLPVAVDKACEMLLLWIEKGIIEAMQQGNIGHKKKELEKKLGE
jgi:PTH1 family peptidyl-tRNA hydrolase